MIELPDTIKNKILGTIYFACQSKIFHNLESQLNETISEEVGWLQGINFEIISKCEEYWETVDRNYIIEILKS